MGLLDRLRKARATAAAPPLSGFEPVHETVPKEYERTMGSWATRDRKAYHILKVGTHDTPAGRTRVVGESFYQDALVALAGPHSQVIRFRTELAVLQPDLNNPYDSKAVAVYIGGNHVGHLSRNDAAVLQPALVAVMERTGKPVACKAEIRGSDNYGVVLYFDPIGLRVADSPGA